MEKKLILTTQEYLKQVLKKRDPAAHKGDFGKVLIYAGSCGMAGAAVLCGRAALKSGAGLVQFLVPGLKDPMLSILQISVPEATCVPAINHPEDYTAIACGSGLGQSEAARAMLTHILETYEGTLLLDADALNMIAGSADLAEKTRSCKASIIITPHIGEARRLLHTKDPIHDPASRREAVCELSRQYQCIAVLKGAGTLIVRTDPEDTSVQIYQNTTGNPGMATAGSGDSLAGIITSLAAQGYPSLEAARIGVFIHGKAGDLAAEELGEMSITASDIITYIPYAIRGQSGVNQGTVL